MGAGTASSVRTGRLRRGLLVGIGSSLVALVLWGFGVLSSFEYRTWDWRTRLVAPLVEPSNKVVQIYIDEYSITRLRETSGIAWPWPREAYALMTRFFERAGARALAYDVLFSDPSIAGVQDDRVFAAAIESGGNVILPVFLGEEDGLSTTWPDQIPLDKVLGANILPGDVQSLPAVASSEALFPMTELASASLALGNVNIVADSDGVYRRGYLLASFDGRLVPTLGLAAYLAGSDAEASLSTVDGGIAVGDRRVPVDKEGRVILRWPHEEGATVYSAWDVIQSELRVAAGEEPTLDPASLEGAFVFVGASARGLYDLRPIPLRPRAPGVTFHATMLDNLITGRFMKELSAPTAIFFLMLFVVPVAVLATFMAGPYRSALLYLLLLPLPVIASIVSHVLGYSWPLLPQVTGVALALVSANVLNFAVEGRQKRYIKNAFQQYLSHAVIEELLAHPERLRLGGERRELTIFFSDLEGFTSISEGLSPEELTALLNDYLSAMSDIIHEEGGTIDKYEGDAIIAFWNAPLSQSDHALRGVRAAVRCQLELARRESSFEQMAGRPLRMRIGINSGPAVVGNMGSRSRFDYSMLGDSVNLAARLEGINKHFGTNTLISKSTADQLDGAFPLREVSRVLVVGRKEPVTLYEPFDSKTFEARRADIEVFDGALRLFYAGDFEAAAAAFKTIEERDPLAAIYRARCQQLREEPLDDWDGIWVMTSK